MVPLRRPLKAAVSTKEFFETFMNLLSPFNAPTILAFHHTQPAAAAHPLHHLEGTSDGAQRNETDHNPSSCGGIGDPHYVPSETDGKQADNGESNRTRDKNQSE